MYVWIFEEWLVLGRKMEKGDWALHYIFNMEMVIT